MIIFAIDPGNIESAWVMFNSETFEVIDKAKECNDMVLARLHQGGKDLVLVVEYPVPRGQPMYYQLIDTIFWIGRFIQVWGRPWHKSDRKNVKMNLCRSTKAKDSNVRAAILGRYKDRTGLGGGKEPVVGIKSNPGPLFGVSKDVWAALGVAITYSDLIENATKVCNSFSDLLE